jgi:His-Xaa-Ser system protein HxsD
MKLSLSIYPIEAIRLACYNLSELAFFFLEEKNLQVTLVDIKPKGSRVKEDIEKEFMEELIACGVYIQQSEKNKEVRETILKVIKETSFNPPVEEEVFYLNEEDLKFVD